MRPLKKSSSPLLSKQLWGYCFLGLLLIQAIFILLNQFEIAQPFTNLKRPYWAIAISISGCLFVYYNQVRFRKIERQTWRIQQRNIKEAKKQFANIHPTLYRVPILGFLAQKWQAEPMRYKLILMGLCLLGAAIYLYDLAYYDWLPDEPLVVRAAKGYLETGSYNHWDFWMNQPGSEKYSRAWPHTWMVAQSIKFLGLSEWSTRLVSVVFGVLFIPIIYGISSFFLQSRQAAIVVTFVCILQPYFIFYFRRVRMYAVLIPLFAVLFYTFYQVLTTKKYVPKTLYKKHQWLRQYFNYNWSLVIGLCIIIFFCIKIHILSLIIFPIIFPLFMYLLVVKKQKRLLLPLATVGVFFLGMILLFSLFLKKEGIGRTFNFFEVYQDIYLEYLLGFPFPEYTSIGILLIGGLLIVLGKNQTRTVALYGILIVTIVLYVYSINYFAHYRYVIHILPFAYMLSIGILMKVNCLFTSKRLQLLLPMMIVMLSISEFADNYEHIYRKHPEAQFSAEAYATIRKNINPDTQGIISLYFDAMYMKGMGKIIQKIDMPNKKQYSLEQFQRDVSKFEGGAWVVWATHKGYHLPTSIHEHIVQNCAKYNGYGMDNTKVEVYYCR